MEKPTFDELAAFAAVAEHRSFRQAADALSVSRSGLSHALRSLEQRLGVRLLNRTTRSVSLTEVGTHFLSRVEPVLLELHAALDSLAESRGTPTGTLRIHAFKSAVQGLLGGIIPSFLSKYPDVRLDLVTDGRLTDIVAEGFDAGIRLAEDVPQDMIAVPFGGDVRFLTVASPAYLARQPAPQVPDDLRHRRCIRHRVPSGRLYRWEFSKRGQEVAVDVPGMLTLDDNALMVLAAADGLGIAYVLELFARERLTAGALVPVLADWCPPIPGLTLFYPGRRHVPSALRAFIDLLKEETTATPPHAL